MRTLLRPRHDRDFQFAKAGLLEPLMQLHLAEAEPLVGVQFARTLEPVAEQVQNDQPLALFWNAVRARDAARNAAPGSTWRGRSSLFQSADLRCRPAGIRDLRSRARRKLRAVTCWKEVMDSLGWRDAERLLDRARIVHVPSFDYGRGFFEVANILRPIAVDQNHAGESSPPWDASALTPLSGSQV